MNTADVCTANTAAYLNAFVDELFAAIKNYFLSYSNSSSNGGVFTEDSSFVHQHKNRTYRLYCSCLTDGGTSKFDKFLQLSSSLPTLFIPLPLLTTSLPIMSHKVNRSMCNSDFIIYKLLSFTLQDSSRNWQTINALQ